MTRLVRALLPVVLVAVAAVFVSAEERFPPPDFTDHQLPPTITPEPSPLWHEYLDVAALFVWLLLASYLALVKRSRPALFVLTIAALAWLGFWRRGCVCPIGAIQNVTLAVFDSTYVIPLSVVAFFALPLLFTLFFGRTFCAAVCPLGAVQEVVAVRPLKVPAWLDHSLGLVPFVYLGAAVLFAATKTAFVICQYDPFVAFFRRSGSINMLILGGCFLVVGLFVGRPYCRYLCPLGAVLGLLSRVSRWHVTIPPEECINCRLCEDACPYGAIREPTVDQSPAARAKGRRRLAMLLVLLPVLIAVGGWLGNRLAIPLSRMHADVRLAERIRLEKTGMVQDTTDASDAFRNTGRPVIDLYHDAISLRQKFAFAGGWLGAWVGLVIGIKLIHLSVRRRRVDYQPDPAYCVSCGRCFWYCPEDRARLGLIENAAVGNQDM